MDLWSLLIISLSGVLAQTSLEKKVFLFPKRSDDTYVLLEPTLEKPLQQFTICLRFFTDSKAASLFSAASSEHDNEILLFRTHSGMYEISVGNEDLAYTVPRVQETSTYWEGICVTWDSETGVVQFWLDGVPFPRKSVARGYKIPSDLVMVLGQEQDSFGGSFDVDQCFIGEMAEVYMWDTVLPPEQLRKPRMDLAPEPLVNWKALRFEIKGYVLMEPSLV